MKKFPPTLELRRAGILHIFLLAFFLVFVSGQVFAQEESSNKLTCDEVWEIVGTEDCPDWSVNTDLGGVWCDIKSLDRAPWTAGLAPKYTFAPGTCKIEKADQPQEQSNQTQTKSSKPAPSPGQSLIGWIKGNIFGGSMPQVESLLESAPTETDLKPADTSPPSPSPEKPLTGVIDEIDGNIDVRLADGTWLPLKNGDFIPAGATIFAGYDSRAFVKFSDGIIFNLKSLEEVSLELFQKDPEAYRRELKLEDGALRFKVEQVPIKTDMKVSTPRATAAVVGTDFGVSYNKDTGVSVWEIYDGSIEVESTSTGEKKTIATTYGSSIKRLEISNDGVMSEKIAIPKNQKSEGTSVWLYVVGVGFLVAVGLFFLKKRGKRFLIPKKKTPR